ncbi:MAG: DHH family phosphoesterase [Candidatus Micrarchaeia archaeon]
MAGGKKSAAAAKKSAAKSQPATDILSAFRSKRTIITFHSLGDLDAIGSAIALRRALGSKSIIAPPDRPSATARKLLSYAGEETTLFSEIKLTDKDIIVALDSASPHLMAHLAGITPDLIIDHHTRFGGELRGKQEICDPAASSTCEMLYFILKPTDKLSCIALLLGLISDTSAFKYATARTFEAASGMLSHSGMSYSQILPIAVSPESLSERIEAIRSCKSVTAEKIGEHVIATAMAKSHEAHFAEVLVHLGADAAFVGCEGEDGRISARMRDCMTGKLHLDKIMFEIGKVLGGRGSGHELAAGASGGKENLRPALGICLKLCEQQLLASEGKEKIRKIEW